MARVAAIDCGTNSVRLLVADLPDDPAGPLVDILRRMEIVRLGEGVDRTGRLADEAIERARIVLGDYAGQIARLGVDRTRMVATSATRDAANAETFHRMVEATLGVAPEVVTGGEEAALSFAGAVRGLPRTARPPYLVVDIGGGSTEVVLGTCLAEDDAGAVRVEAAVSVDIGCVRMTERHLRDDPPTPAQIRAAEADIGSAVDRALAAVDGAPDPAAGGGGRTLVGVAGSVTTVTAMALGLDSYRPERIHHARVSYADVDRVTTDLLAMTRAQRLGLGVMHPGRADVIGAGAMILRAVMRRAGAPAVIASEHDVLDGIAWSLV